VDRAKFRQQPAPTPPSQVPTRVEPVVPVALPSRPRAGDTPFADEAPMATAVDDFDDRPRGMSLLFKGLTVLVVVVSVFVIGKTFLFQ
jgi:hypothetical protein